MAKSIHLSCPAAFTSMLSGLTSQWTHPLAFMYASPVAACLKIVRACSLMNARSLPISRVRIDPDGKYSMMKCGECGVPADLQDVDHVLVPAA